MSACAVLHVTSIPGGGVDRHVRDLVSGSARPHIVWHVGADADVVEVADEPRYLPLDRAAFERDPSAFAAWLRARGVGLVHLHSMGRPVRGRAAWAAVALAAPTLVTLHDVLFLRPDGFEPGAPRTADPAWLAEVAPVLRTARAVLAPSRFIADLAEISLPGLQLQVVPNGTLAPERTRLEPRAEFQRMRPRRVIAALGALGPHKGSRVLEAVAARLAGTGAGIVVIGYTDAQAWPGWFDDALFIHGPYAEVGAGALLSAYGAEAVLFPNTVPEGFSYALSEAWAAGVPAIVPPEGALAERVRSHGGGWVLPEDFGVDSIVERIEWLGTEAGKAEAARVKSGLAHHDLQRLPSIDGMTRALEDLYRRHGIDPAAPVDALALPTQSLIATQLDSGLFRRELLYFAEELARMREGPDAERLAARKFEVEARGWIAKLEIDVATLQHELRAEFAKREALDRARAGWRVRQRIASWLPQRVRRLLGKGGDARD